MERKNKDVDSKTQGLGMVFMHEVSHNDKIGNNLKDPPLGSLESGENVDFINNIREELGERYGQRESYHPIVMYNEKSNSFIYIIPYGDGGIDKYVKVSKK